MEKQCCSHQFKNTKGYSSVTLGRTKSNHKQSHHPNFGNYNKDHSPKTLDYNNVIKKMSNQKKNKTKVMERSCNQIKQFSTQKNKTPMHSTDRINYHNHISKDLKYNESEENKYHTLNMNEYNSNLKERVDFLEEELYSLKGKKHDDKDNMKMTLFINLVRKYCKKLFALVNIENQTNTESSQITNELIQTIEQFSKMVFNRKVDQILLSPSTPQSEKKPQFIPPKEFEAIISGYEETITKIQKQKEELDQLILLKDQELSQTKNTASDETVSLRKKLYDQMRHNEDIEKHIMCLKTVNKDLESKCIVIDEENMVLKKQLSKMDNPGLENEMIKNNYQNELKYKDSIISYLESLLNKTPLQTDLIGKEVYEDNYNKLNSKGKKETIDTKKNDTIKEDEDLEYKTSSVPTDKPVKIKQEIDEIDNEIYQLQSQLRQMLDKK